MAANDFGAFLASNPDVSTPDRLQSTVNLMALLLNLKDTGYYVQNEFVCGQVYFPNTSLAASGQDPTYRQVFRKVVNFGALPDGTIMPTKDVAHNIPVQAANGGNNYAGYTFTRIYGTASDTTTRAFIPIPYVAGLNGAAVSLDVNQTNVSITTTDNKTNFNVCYVVLEYLKY